MKRPTTVPPETNRYPIFRETGYLFVKTEEREKAFEIVG